MEACLLEIPVEDRRAGDGGKGEQHELNGDDDLWSTYGVTIVIVGTSLNDLLCCQSASARD